MVFRLLSFNFLFVLELSSGGLSNCKLISSILVLNANILIEICLNHINHMPPYSQIKIATPLVDYSRRACW